MVSFIEGMDVTPGALSCLWCCDVPVPVSDVSGEQNHPARDGWSVFCSSLILNQYCLIAHNIELLWYGGLC